MAWTDLELRWVIFGLGLLVVVGVWLGGVIAARWRPRESLRSEPTFTTSEVPGGHGLRGPAATFEAADDAAARQASPYAPTVEQPEPATDDSDVVAKQPDPARIISLRLVATQGDVLDGQQTVLALRAAGMQHGPFEIFHYLLDPGVQDSGFSVANLVEPGTFDLANVAGTTLPGMSFFLVLPGSGDPVQRFDRMVEIARNLADRLAAGLFDEEGNSWSIQRERYIREELIEYRHSGFSA